MISTLWLAIPTKWKIFGVMGIVFVFACFMALRAHDKEVAAKAIAPYEKASNEAAMDAVNGERRANANSEVRRDANDATDAHIRKGIDDAKANGDSPIDGYFNGLRKASGGRTDKPAK